MEQQQGPSTFISHSTLDDAFVQKLANDLERHGIKTWVDEAEIRPGDDFISTIEEGLRKATHVIIVLSPQSIISSWVREETHAAQLRAIHGEARLIPLLLGDLNTADIPLLLQSRLYVDFREPSKYPAEFRRLLSAFEISPIEGITEKAEVFLPRIEDVHILRGDIASGYAIEVLLMNPSSEQVFIRQATIGCLKPDALYPDALLYAKPPPIYTYELSLKLEAYSQQDRLSLRGIAREPEDHWGRPASGHILVRGRHFAFEISCPLYLQVAPKERAVIRFIFGEPELVPSDEVRSHLWDIPRSVPESAPSFRDSSESWTGQTWIVLEGDLDQPIAATINDHTLLEIFRGIDIGKG